MPNTCRARNPLTCRTHGERIRQDIAAVHRTVDTGAPFDVFTKQEAIDLVGAVHVASETSAEQATKILDDLYRTRQAGVRIQRHFIADAFEAALVQARFDLHRGPIDFSSYPLTSLRTEHRGSQGYMDRRIWLRDHGIPDDADDTVFGTTYIYCAQHVRPHASGWCTVSIADKGPLSAQNDQDARAEARGLGFRIYGED